MANLSSFPGFDLSFMHDFEPPYELQGARVLEYNESSAMIQTPQDATHLIGEALAAKADWVYLPSSCLSDAFFQLRSGLLKGRRGAVA